MDFWKRLPIAVQFSVLLAVAVVLGAACAYQIGGTIYVNEARNQARTVADMVVNMAVLGGDDGVVFFCIYCNHTEKGDLLHAGLPCKFFLIPFHVFYYHDDAF